MQGGRTLWDRDDCLWVWPLMGKAGGDPARPAGLHAPGSRSAEQHDQHLIYDTGNHVHTDFRRDTQNKSKLLILSGRMQAAS